MVNFTVEYPNNIYVTMRNVGTGRRSEIMPFTISYGYKSLFFNLRQEYLPVEASAMSTP